MIAKTNLNEIKEVARLLLEFPIKINKEFELICYHPFIRDTFSLVTCEKTKENPMGVEQLDIRDEDNLEKVKKMYREAIDDCKEASDFFLIINKPYSGVFFKVIKDYLDIKDYTEMLETLWTTMEYPNADVNVSQKEWISYWKNVDLSLIYSEEDKKTVDNLPEEFTVYRGLMERAKVKALSWTLDKDKAIWFAKRFNNHGKVYKAKARKNDILAYLSNRGESEIVIDYKKLKDIEEVEYEEI